MSSILADLVLLLHAAFVVFVVGGGLLVLRWPKVAWAHLPAAVWGAVVEITGWICPLTPLENALRERAGEDAYNGDFVARYIAATLYPEGLTRESQLLLGGAVIILNAAIYGAALTVARRRRTEDGRSAAG